MAPATIFLGARSLAALALPGACPGCFVVRLRCRRELPFQIGFPAILSITDRLAKRAVHHALDATGRLPGWMPVLGPVMGYARGLTDDAYKWFRHYDARTSISVCGVPDDVLLLADGTLHIVDYKASSLTEGQRRVLPLYEAQLNIYAFIAERLRRRSDGRIPGPVSGLTIVYLQPQSEPVQEAEVDGRWRRLSMGFRPKAVAVRRCAEELVPDLLLRARCAVDEAGRVGRPCHLKGCRERARMDRLREAETGDKQRATLGRSHRGLCLTCERVRRLAPGASYCFDCRASIRRRQCP